MIKKLNHVGIIVKDINQVLGLYETALGLKPGSTGINEIPGAGAKNVMLPIANGSGGFIELIEPTDSSSPFGKFLEQGGGLYHISLTVDNLEAEVKSMQERGVLVGDIADFSSSPMRLKTAFVRRRYGLGARIELVELL